MKPLTKDAWNEVIEISAKLTNSILAEDTVLSDVHRSSLFETLDSLEQEFGTHPELISTRADFTQDLKTRRKLYTKALQIAQVTHNLREIREIKDSLSRLESEHN